MANLEEQRKRIDAIDEQIVKLFRERMNVAAEVARYKKEHGVKVLSQERERDVVYHAADAVGEELEEYVKSFYNVLLDLSRDYQREKIDAPSPFVDAVRAALAETPGFFPHKATVACQGIEGAYSQQACDKLFSIPKIFYFKNFEGVCQAVDSGMCRYGILPIENSSAGSVNAVYDLTRKYNFHIVRCLKLKVEHNLLAKPGVKLGEIREIVSHEQALLQCGEFLKKHPEIKATVCENTAVAARIVANSERTDIAAIASGSCAEIYGLESLSERIQNSDHNYTRFICISKKLEIYPDGDKITFTTTLAHRPGALHNLISRFASLGLNVCKIESRPILGKDFEFRFYFDVEGTLRSEPTLKMLARLESEGNFEFLGAYREQL